MRATLESSIGRRVAVPLVILAIAGGVGASWLLTVPEPDAATPRRHLAPDPSTADAHEPVSPVAPAPTETPATPADVPTPRRAHVQATGRQDPVVDIEDEDAMAAQAYRDRIEENIASLADAAKAARLDGNVARAELMERRISGLERRLEAFEADQP